MLTAHSSLFILFAFYLTNPLFASASHEPVDPERVRTAADGGSTNLYLGNSVRVYRNTRDERFADVSISGEQAKALYEALALKEENIEKGLVKRGKILNCTKAQNDKYKCSVTVVLSTGELFQQRLFVAIEEKVPALNDARVDGELTLVPKSQYGSFALNGPDAAALLKYLELPTKHEGPADGGSKYAAGVSAGIDRNGQTYAQVTFNYRYGSTWKPLK